MNSVTNRYDVVLKQNKKLKSRIKNLELLVYNLHKQNRRLKNRALSLSIHKEKLRAKIIILEEICAKQEFETRQNKNPDGKSGRKTTKPLKSVNSQRLLIKVLKEILVEGDLHYYSEQYSDLEKVFAYALSNLYIDRFKKSPKPSQNITMPERIRLNSANLNGLITLLHVDIRYYLCLGEFANTTLID